MSVEVEIAANISEKKMCDVCLTGDPKIALLKTSTNKKEPVYCITREDVQAEAIDSLGRLLTDDEIKEVKDKLEWGIGESLGIIYNTIFTEIIPK